MKQLNNNTETWKKASEVYADVIDLSPQAALAHVHDIKSITSEVRRAVITLINAGSQASLYFQDHISAQFNHLFNIHDIAKVGDQLGEYQLLEELGQGGMSQVFKASRIDTEQQKPVAIKVFAPRNQQQELLKHFISEQKILANLSHQNIVKMLHGGMTKDQVPYLVMELIEGAKSLTQYCHDNQIDTKKKMHLILQCAQALAYSHANLIIHRDLKPDNILVNINNEVKIVDFGIAKLINQDISGHKTTIMALTPNYAAPEQINAGQISVKTDVFSLAVVALSLMTNESVLPEDRLIKSCANDEQHLDKLLKSLKCDSDLTNILQKALAQQPDHRYQSMQSFADDINNWLQYKPVKATAHSLWYRLQKFAHRRSALFATLISFAAFLIIGSIVGYQQYQQISIEAEKANQVKQFMLEAFTQTNPDLSKGDVVTAEDILHDTAEKLQNADLDKEIKSELLQTVGIAYGQIGQYQKAADFLQKSLYINPNDSKSLSYIIQNLSNAENLKALNQQLQNIDINSISNSKDQARIYRVMAKSAARESDFDTAISTINKAIALDESIDEKNEVILSQRLLIEFHYLQSQHQKAISIAQDILNQDGIDPTSSLIMGIRSDLATIYTDMGSADEAKKLWEELIADQRKILGNTHPEVANSLIQLSGVYRYMGNLVQAIETVEKAHDIHLNVFGQEHLNTARSLNSLAVMSYQAGDVPKAIEQMYQVLDIFQEKQSADYSETLEIKTNLAALLSLSDRLEEAEKISRDVYNTQLNKLGMTHKSTIYSQQVLARVLLQLKRIDEAEQLSLLAYHNANEHLETKNMLTAGAYTNLAKVYLAKNHYQKALDIYQKIINHNMIAESHPNYPAFITDLADTYKNLNMTEQATKHYLKSIESHHKIYGENHKKTDLIKQKYKEFLHESN